MARIQSQAATFALIAAGFALGFLVVFTQTGSATGLLDLRIYIGAARSFQDGASIYAYIEPTFRLGSTYPPLWSLLLSPVSHLDIHAIEYTWTFVNLCLWMATLFLVCQAHSFRDASRPISTNQVLLVWLLTLPSAPVWNTINQGQLNILVWFLLVLDIRAITDRSRWGGLATGICTALKLLPAIGVAMYVMARRWRAALIATASFALVTGIAQIAARDDGRLYWTKLVFDTTRIGSIADSQSNSLRALLARTGLSGWVELLFWIVGSITILVLATSTFRRSLAASATITSSLMLGSAMSLMSPITWTHHLVFLGFLLPLAFSRRDEQRSWKARLAVGAVTLALIDPVGFGRSGVTSSVRTVMLVVLVLTGPRLLKFELRWRGSEVEPPTSPGRTGDRHRQGSPIRSDQRLDAVSRAALPAP